MANSIQRQWLWHPYTPIDYMNSKNILYATLKIAIITYIHIKETDSVQMRTWKTQVYHPNELWESSSLKNTRK